MSEKDGYIKLQVDHHYSEKTSEQEFDEMLTKMHQEDPKLASILNEISRSAEKKKK